MATRLLKRWALAVTAVTSIPLADLHQDPHALSGLSKYLPAVGLLIGTILSLVALALLTYCHLAPLSIAVVLALSWLVISGGIHFDGLMDTADGIFSHTSPQRMLEIMKDSRVGNFGVMTGFAVLILKIAGLADVAESHKVLLFGALILIPIWSRWCETFTIGRFPYLRPQGLGKVWHDTTLFPLDPLKALIVPLAASATLTCTLPVQAVAMITLATIACGVAAAYYVNSILKGQTGDTYGAVVELSESGALLLLMLAT